MRGARPNPVRWALASALCAAVGGVFGVAGYALAQGMVMGGNALDANPMYGSGGYNGRTARRMPMQQNVYTVQDGRMKYNEAAAFSQPRYVPVGREGQAQASAMIYSSRAPRNPNLATQTGYGAPMSDPRAGTFRDYTQTAPANALQRPVYRPTPSSNIDPSLDYRLPPATPPAGGGGVGAPIKAGSAPDPLQVSAAADNAVNASKVRDQKYRVSGVQYGGW